MLVQSYFKRNKNTLGNTEGGHNVYKVILMSKTLSTDLGPPNHSSYYVSETKLALYAKILNF